MVAGNLTIRGVVADSENFARLNIADGSGVGFRPGEADAAAILEHALEVNLIRSTDAQVDFVIASGPRTGETIDFIYTVNNPTTNAVSGLNSNIATELLNGETSRLINEYLAKADVVPVDLRHINEVNSTGIRDFVTTLTATEQSQIIFIE